MTTLAYRHLNGLHPETASLTSLFAQAGLRTPGGPPLDEALVLGIGGGLGAGYILWEFQQHHLRVLVLGMRNRWQYSDSLLDKLSARLNLRLNVAETSGAKGAQAALDAAMGMGRAAMLWVDPSHLPYMHLPAALSGCYGHTLVAYGKEGDSWLVDDRAAHPFLLSSAEMAAARGRIPSYKNRLVTVESAGEFDLAAALRAGIGDCARHLAQPSDSFSLPAIRKWARLMTDAKHAKGWPRVFGDGAGIFSALVSVFDGVSDYGAGGGSLRRLYADFLTQAAALLEQDRLREVAERYKWLGLRWGALGELALPTEVAPLAHAKDLLARRAALYAVLGGEGASELAAIAAELDALRADCDAHFPLDPARQHELFAAMQAQLQTIYSEEVEANRLLGEVAA